MDDKPALSPAGGSTWAPLRIGVFRAVWVAALVSNLGSWMHMVAAAWLMTSLTASAAMVALLQSANALPSFPLALPAGAMADVFDRRRLILVTQGARPQQPQQLPALPGRQGGPYPGSSSRLRFCCRHTRMIDRRLRPVELATSPCSAAGQTSNGCCRTS
jgi:Transmembrane secretion effector